MIDKPKNFGPRKGGPRAAPDAGTKIFRPTVRKLRKPEPAATIAVAPKADDAQRIAKVMARAGLCSRRDAEGWIAQGRVEVNGVQLTSPAFNVQPGDRVTVDGSPLAARERTRLFAFHKPRGFVTTDRDPEGRPTVFDHLASVVPMNAASALPRLVTIGRLDINTEGLLLLTNDGGLARVLELPATGWLRRYRVRANGEVEPGALEGLRDGVTIDGVSYIGIEATLDRVQGANVWLTMGLREGKNREIKRVLEHLGLAVTRLIRISFGPFQLGELAEGAVEEIPTRVLRDQLGAKLALEAGADFDSPIAGETAGPLRAAPKPRPKLSLAGDEKRERPASGARKHVSRLRADRAQDERSGERTRIERRGTEDRKGRAILVERVVAARPPRARDGEEAATRNGRRFAKERPPEAAQKPRLRKPRGEGGRERPPEAQPPKRFERPQRRAAAPGGAEAPRERGENAGKSRQWRDAPSRGAGEKPRQDGPKRFDRSMRGKMVEGPAPRPARSGGRDGFKAGGFKGGGGKPGGAPKGPRGPRPPSRPSGRPPRAKG